MNILGNVDNVIRNRQLDFVGDLDYHNMDLGIFLKDYFIIALKSNIIGDVGPWRAYALFNWFFMLHNSLFVNNGKI